MGLWKRLWMWEPTCDIPTPVPTNFMGCPGSRGDIPGQKSRENKSLEISLGQVGTVGDGLMAEIPSASYPVKSSTGGSVRHGFTRGPSGACTARDVPNHRADRLHDKFLQASSLDNGKIQVFLIIWLIRSALSSSQFSQDL